MASLLRYLGRIIDFITKGGAALASLCLAAIVLIYCYEVAARYAFDAPTTWASDVVAFGLCLSVFLMVPEVTRTGAHVAITIVLDQLPHKYLVIARWLIAIVACGACLTAAWASGQENMRQFTYTITTLSTMAIPKWWISGFISYGLLLSALQFLKCAAPVRTPAV